MLGTIRHDAPIEFMLPETLWKESVNMQKAEDFFRELEFRALPTRLKEVLTGKKADVAVQSSLVSTVQNDISPKALSELLIALWVLDSNKTTPTIEDITAYAKTDSLAEAQKVIFDRLAREAGSRRVFEEIEKPLIPIIEKMKSGDQNRYRAQFKKLSLTCTTSFRDLKRDLETSWSRV